MSTIISGSSPSVTFSDGTTQASAAISTMVLLNTLTASNSATLSDTTSLTSTYDLYMFAFESLVPSTSSAVAFYIQYSSNGGSTWLTSGYNGTYSNTLAGTLNASQNSFSPAIQIGVISSTDGTLLNASGYGLSGIAYMNTPSSSSVRKYTYGSGAVLENYQAGGQTQITQYLFGGAYDANTALNAVRFSMSTGNISSGKIRIYGIKTS